MMADVDLSGEQITIVPSKTVGQKTTVHYTRDQKISFIQLFFDYQDNAGAYLGSSDVIITDGVAGEQWGAAQTLVEDPTKTPEDLVNILVAQAWGKELLADKWRRRDIIQIDGK